MIQAWISTMLACLQLCTMVVPQPTLMLSREKPTLSSFCLSVIPPGVVWLKIMGEDLNIYTASGLREPVVSQATYYGLATLKLKTCTVQKLFTSRSICN